MLPESFRRCAEASYRYFKPHINGGDPDFGTHQIGPPQQMWGNFEALVINAPCADFVHNWLVSIHFMYLNIRGARPIYVI